MKKKIIGILVVAVLAMGVMIPVVLAAPKVPNPSEFDLGEARQVQMENVGFHCASQGGNGRVWIDAYDVKAAEAKKSGVKWIKETIIYVDDNSWLLANTTDYVCPVCGGTMWVSYSNKSGVPDGKNMQLTHYYPPSDEWFPSGVVSFTKEMLGGLDLYFEGAYNSVFDFDLFKLSGSGAYDIHIGTFTTGYSYFIDNGTIIGEETMTPFTVSIGGLPIGKYVFKEVIGTLVFSAGLGYVYGTDTMANNYNLVWKPVYPGGRDGLYFEIDPISRLGVFENQSDTVNNMIASKHSWLWAPDGYDPATLLFVPIKEVIELGEGNGNIIIFDGYCTSETGTMEVIGIVPPTCQSKGIIWVGCTCGCSGTGIEFGELLPHELVPVALAPGFGDGWVWVACQGGCGTSDTLYDKDAWLALGGYDF